MARPLVDIAAPWLLVAVMAAACTSSSGGSPTGTGGGGAGGGGAGGGGGSATCASAASFTAAAPDCNTVTNGATAVPFTAATGTPPAPMGGTIADGVYYATRAAGYGSATPAGRKLTIAILDGATRMLWAGDVLDASGTTTSLSFRADATAVVSGTQIAMTTTCSSASTSPLPAALDYTATSSGLVLSLTMNGATSVTTYARQGCP